MKNKIILITGSSRGIGAATARLAYSRGAKVIVHGRSDSEELRRIADELNAFKIFCDVSDKSSVFDAIKTVLDEFGQIDGLVNSAGIARFKPFLEMENEDWKEEFETNVLGTVNFCQAVIPIMQRQGNGSIANVSSIRGINQLVSNRGMSYSISKVSITGLTSALAKEFAPVIRVNAVAPGFTNTDMAKTWNDSVRKQANSALLGRVAEPKEIAAALLFLISDDSSFVTGQTLIVDGGYGLAGK